MKHALLTIFRWLKKALTPPTTFISHHRPVLLSSAWILAPYLTIIALLIVMAIRMYQCNKRRYNLNKNLEEYIKTVRQFEKGVDQLNDTMNEVSADDGLDGQQRDKVRLAIWRINALQNSLKTLKALEMDSEWTTNLGDIKKSMADQPMSGLPIDTPSYHEEPPLPDLEESDGVDQYFLEKVFSIIRECYVDPSFNVDALSQKMGMSRSSFYTKIKAISGQAPADFIRQYRMERAKELLKTKQYSITDVALQSGFTDVKYFRDVFRKKYNRSPSQYAKSSN